MDEMGSEDVPVTVNYILNVTRDKKLSFVCVSFGCNLFFIAAITQPEINNSIDVMVGLAPAGILKNAQTRSLKLLDRFWDGIMVNKT